MLSSPTVLPLGIAPSAATDATAWTIASKLDRWDLSEVMDKLVHDGEIEKADVSGASLEFKRFAFLAGMGVQPLAMIGPVVDQVWHQFILFTADYADFCGKTLGFFLGHRPDTPQRPLPTEAAQNLFEAYEKFFGPLTPIWFKGMTPETISYYGNRPLKGRPPMRWSGWTGE